jgi:hypothetical protein
MKFVATFELLLIICEILGSHGGLYEECHLLVCLHVILVRTDVLEERIASIFRVRRMNEIRTRSDCSTLHRTTVASYC